MIRIDALHALPLLMLLPLAGEAQAQSTLVSNVGQTTSLASWNANGKAQGFTTGSHSNGYDLSSIILEGANFSGSNGNTATLHQGSVTGTQVASFTSAAGGSQLTLTPSAAVVLEASTEYFVVTDDDLGNAAWLSTVSDNEDADGVAGWNIADDSEIFETDLNSWVTMTFSFLFSVTGSEYVDPAPPPPGSTTSVSAKEEEIPGAVRLDQNYPNPFNPSTTIEYALSASSRVRISVWDVMGRETAVLVDETKTAGRHKAIFDARNLPSGLYVYRMETVSGVLSKTMLLIK